MGSISEMKCLDCGQVFEAALGGGFFFHKLLCDQCGADKDIGFDELGELHLRYLKGLPGPYCVASSEHDKYIREHTSLSSISEDEYNKGIDALAGKCRCGGKYKLDAPPRCPKCHSTNLEEGEVSICYD